MKSVQQFLLAMIFLLVRGNYFAKSSQFLHLAASEYGKHWPPIPTRCIWQSLIDYYSDRQMRTAQDELVDNHHPCACCHVKGDGGYEVNLVCHGRRQQQLDRKGCLDTPPNQPCRISIRSMAFLTGERVMRMTPITSCAKLPQGLHVGTPTAPRRPTRSTMPGCFVETR